MPLKHHEEVKAAVAQVVDNCQSCKDDDFCQECREDIKHLQEVNDFDVTEYVSKTVPADLTENTAGSDGDSSSPVSRAESQGEGAAKGSSSQRESPGEPPKTSEELTTASNAEVLECDECGDLVIPAHHDTFRAMKETTCSKCDFGKLKRRKKDVVRRNDIHLWLADLKKEMDFDSREEAEGARKLVERAGWELGTHGYQILKEQLEEDDSDS